MNFCNTPRMVWATYKKFESFCRNPNHLELTSSSSLKLPFSSGSLSFPRRFRPSFTIFFSQSNNSNSRAKPELRRTDAGDPRLVSGLRGPLIFDFASQEKYSGSMSLITREQIVLVPFSLWPYISTSCNVLSSSRGRLNIRSTGNKLEA